MPSTPTAPPLPIQNAFQQALAAGVFPGAVILVQDAKGRRWQAAYGVADLSTGETVREDTFFDLASLTKPLCTTLAVLCLVQSGRLSLEDRLGQVAPVFADSDKADIRIHQLLCHQSGLSAWRPYFETLRQQPVAERGESLRRLLVHDSLAYRPGTNSVYSDLDFMVLQIVVETVGGQRLDHFAARNLYGPLGIRTLFFTDTGSPPPGAPFAATEDCAWRRQVLKGHVHDDNAYVIGGIAGHAGLFGTAAGVADLLSALLSACNHQGHAAIIDSARLRQFFQRRPPSDWALGFDTPAASGSSSGRYFSSNSVGHLGYTGTSFWMDLDREIIVVLLTNRIHPARTSDGIKSFRPLIHDCVMEVLGYG